MSEPTPPRCPKCGGIPEDWHKNIQTGWCRPCNYSWFEPDVSWLRGRVAELEAQVNEACGALADIWQADDLDESGRRKKAEFHYRKIRAKEIAEDEAEMLFRP